MDLAPAWSRDGQELAFIRAEVQPGVDGTHARAVAVVPDAYSVEWHPDGQVLLVSAFAREDGTVLVVDLDTGDATRIAEHATFAA